MKIKKIILVVLFSILTLGSKQNISIHADKELVEETINEHLPQIKRSSISESESSLHEDVENYLQTKYGTTGWRKSEHNTTETVSNAIPVEMQYATTYSEKMIKDVCKELNLKSSYGGCGPIAMIGMADFFARYLGYTEIINNPDDLGQQKELIKEFLNQNTIPTMEIVDPDPNSTGKQTLALPWNCAKGFNQVMKNHNLDNTIKAIDMGFFLVSKKEKIAKIKEQIDIGLPVTLYTALAGSGDLGNHYVNVYGYEDWIGTNQYGNNITHTMLEFRMNWAEDPTKSYYMDSDILGSFITGIIYYEITYKYQVLPDMLFMSFKNEQNQGQYFNEVVESPISIKEYEVNMSFMTRRLRCSYLNQGYLVLSANRDNHDTAYLEFEFEEDVRQVGLDLWKWSNKEKFQTDASLRLEYFDKTTNQWETAKEINVFLLPIKEEMPKYLLVRLPKGAKKIRLIVENKGITTDRNKGRIAIYYIDAFFDTYNQVYKPHEHIYKDRFEYYDESAHWAYCVCGRGTREQHIFIDENSACIACGGKNPSHEHTWNMINYDETCHKVYCECGEYVLEEHSHTYETIDMNTHRYYCECGDSHIESHIINTSSHIHGAFECIKCNQPINIAHNFTSSYESNGANGHIAYCECGESTTEEHTFVTQNGKTVCQYCEYEQPHIHQYVYEEYNETHHKKVCECGDIIMEEHSINTSDQIHGTFKCDKCNQSIEISHNFTHHYHHKDMEEHIAYCECGEFIIESHNFTHSYYNNCEEFHEIFCKCGASIEEEHSYTHLCESIDEDYHNFYCICGRVHKAEHSIDTTGKKHGDHVYCYYCNEEIQIPHSYGISFEYDDSDKHRSYCECGNYIEEEHEFKFYHEIDDEYHVVYCKCAKPIIEKHTLSEDGVCIYCNH